MPASGRADRRAPSFAEWKRERRGAALIIVAITCVVMLAFVGVGVDFARAYAFRTQVKTVADAAAMAGAVTLAGANRANAGQVALAYVPRNAVEGRGVATVSAADVVAVHWDFDSRSVTASYAQDFANAQVNAVQVTAQYPMQTTFGRAANVLQIQLRETTVAALGGVGAQDCLKPWAVSYQTIIDLLNTRWPQSPPRTVADALSSEDVARLRADTANGVSLLSSNTNQTTGGNINKVVTYSEGNGGSAYRDAISEPGCSGLDLPIGPGTWLESVQGAGAGGTGRALHDFCSAEVNGGAVGPASGNFTCPGHPRVKLAMWDSHNGSNGDGLRFHVKSVGVFAVTGFIKGTGPGQPPDQIQGFFVDQASGGAFTGAAGLTFKPAIVF